jgi:hypothetical protein
MFQTKVVQQITINFVISNSFVLENPAVYGTMEKYLEPDRSQTTIRGLCVACWIPKAYVILIAFPLLQWLHECSSILRYTYIACIVIFYVTDRQTDGRMHIYI